MAIYGIGTDIVRLERVRELQGQFPDRFSDRILSLEEKDMLEDITHPERQIAHLGKRFAAKEALAKALGTGIGEAFGFQDSTIFNYDSGKPGVALSAKGDALFRKKLGDRKYTIHLSLTDEHDYALAYVIIEVKD